MNRIEFNEKYKNYIEGRHRGLDLNNQKVIDYLDKEFTEEIKENPDFTYAQIKQKFFTSRVYADSDKIHIWEKEIDRIFKEDEMVHK
jgi:hypothetical protein